MLRRHVWLTPDGASALSSKLGLLVRGKRYPIHLIDEIPIQDGRVGGGKALASGLEEARPEGSPGTSGFSALRRVAPRA